MRKLLLAILISYGTTYSQCENQSKSETRDKYEAINAYLFTVVKDTSRTTVMIKQKMSPNRVLELFSGGNRVNFDYTKHKDIENPELGIQKPLFNWENYNRMRIKYRDSVNTNAYGISKNKYWTPKDFKIKNFFFENYDTVINKLGTSIPIYEYETQLIILSDPIYYKEKKYLVFGVTNQKSTLMRDFTSSVIVMKKINKKWLVVDKADQYWFE